MSYAKQIADLASAIKSTAENLEALEKSKSEWLSGKGCNKSLFIGWHVPMYTSDGSITPALKAVHREVIKVHDEEIFKAKSKLEGQRWKLTQIAKAIS